MSKVNFIPGQWAQGYIMHQQRMLLLQPLLLDTYTGAAAAYSLRKLRTDYTGAAIRVRESATNTEADIGFNADGTLNTTALLAHVGANNGFVTTWYDQSGNARNATQSTAANQPQIVSSGVVILSGSRPMLEFTNDFLGLSAEFSLTNQHYFVALDLAAEITSATAGQSIFRGGAVSAQQATAFGLGSITGALTNERESWIHVDDPFTGVYGVGQVTANVPAGRHLYSAMYATTPLTQIHRDGALLTTTNATGGAFSATKYPRSFRYIGASSTATSPYVGKMGELILYPSNQSSNRTAIESNINAFYNIYP